MSTRRDVLVRAPLLLGAAPPVGPEVSAKTFAEAEKPMQVTLRE